MRRTKKAFAHAMRTYKALVKDGFDPTTCETLMRARYSWIQEDELVSIYPKVDIHEEVAIARWVQETQP